MSKPFISCWLMAATLACTGMRSATARIVARYTPDQFVAAADAVCNGVVLKTRTTAETTVLLFDKENPMVGGIQMRYMVAQVRVIGRYKGAVPAEIRVRYAAYDPPDRPGAVVNPPDLIQLNPGSRCRFFLKAPSEKTHGCYVGVQDGTFDDGRSVETLFDGEEDGALPFLQARAQRLATAYVRKTFPDYIPRKTDFDFDYYGDSLQLRWRVLAGWNRPGRKLPEALATMMIDEKGKVLPGSWIALGKPTPPGRDLRRFLGKQIQLKTRDEHDKQDPRSVYPGREYRGRVEAITDQGLTGHFIENWTEKPEPMRFLRREIATVQFVAEPPR